MDGKIAFEEHMAVEEAVEETRAFAGESGVWDTFTQELLDVDARRLGFMDETGIEFAILSNVSPGIQAILNADQAMATAKKANDKIAAAMQKHPKRFGGFATLPMHDAQAASGELTRCVRELGFKGAMLNGFQQKDEPDNVLYYDVPQFHDFWATVSELDVPVYLHPRMQIPSRAQNYDGHPWLMSAPWGFAVETSIHALRICGSGIFDEFPNIKLCLGHLGENIPFALERLENRMRFSPRGYRGKRPLGDYFRDHCHLTTSGNFNDAPLRCTIDVIGIDKVYFAADFPFERMEDAASWFDGTDEITPEEKRRIGRENAIRLFNLDLD